MQRSPLGYFCSAVLFFLSFQSAPGQTPGFTGGYGIEIGIGAWLQGKGASAVTTDGAIATAKTQGVGGSLAFHHWTSENFAVGLTVSVINGEASVVATQFFTESQTSTVSSFMLDLRYQLPIGANAPLIPYIHGSAGPVFGFRASSGLSGEVASTQTAMGVRIGAGLNVPVSHLIVLGLRGSYLAMTEFSDPIAGRKSYNGGEALLTIAFVWGAELASSE